MNIKEKRKYYREMYSSIDPIVEKTIDLLGSMKTIWVSDDPWITKESLIAMYLETPECRAKLYNLMIYGGLNYDHEGRRIR